MRVLIIAILLVFLIKWNTWNNNWSELTTDQTIFKLPTPKDTLSTYEWWLIHLQARESYQHKPYDCPSGFKTIGYGHNITVHGDKYYKKYLENGSISYDNAKKLLEEDVQRYIDKINIEFPHIKDERKVLALASLIFNIGFNNMKYSNKVESTFYKELMQGKTPKFSRYIYFKNKKKRYQISPNLKKARAYEEALFTGDTKKLYLYNLENQKTILLRDLTLAIKNDLYTKDHISL